MTNRGVQLHSAILTLVDPWRGHEVEFNRWYERDHLYAGAMLGPDVFSAGRFLARDVEKLVRRVPEACNPDEGTMLAAYWLAGDGADYWRWSAGNVRQLVDEGRMPGKGTVRAAVSLQNPWAYDCRSDGVPAELALDRRFPVVVATIVEAGEPQADLDQWYRRVCAQPLGERADGPALMVGGTAAPIPGLGSSIEVSPGRTLVALWFFDMAYGDDRCGDDVAAFVNDHNDRTRLAGAVAWTSPFISTVPGTDRGVDRLWLCGDRSTP